MPQGPFTTASWRLIARAAKEVPRENVAAKNLNSRRKRGRVLAAMSKSSENHAMLIGTINQGFAYLPYRKASEFSDSTRSRPLE